LSASISTFGKSYGSETIIECVETGLPLIAPKGIFLIAVNRVSLASAIEQPLSSSSALTTGEGDLPR
jgi:hypothetical protein